MSAKVSLKNVILNSKVLLFTVHKLITTVIIKMTIVFHERVPDDWYTTIGGVGNDDVRVRFNFALLGVPRTLGDELRYNVTRILQSKDAGEDSDMEAAEFVFYCFNRVFSHLSGNYQGQEMRMPDAYHIVKTTFFSGFVV